MTQIAYSVLTTNESTSDLKKVAVECIDLWVKLPGAQISDFLHLFSTIFENISNNP